MKRVRKYLPYVAFGYIGVAATLNIIDMLQGNSSDLVLALRDIEIAILMLIIIIAPEMD